MRVVSLFLVLPLAVACSDSAQDPTALAPESASLLAAEADGPERATGHWEFSPEWAIVAKYSANAIRQEDGSVTGQFELREVTEAGTNRVHGEVTCMATLPDGTARVGGVVTKETYADFDLVGTEAVWIIQDNGEGRNSPPDMGSDIRYGFPPDEGTAQAFCDGFFFPDNPAQPLLMLPIERGNIQVRFVEGDDVPLPG